MHRGDSEESDDGEESAKKKKTEEGKIMLGMKESRQ